MSTKPAIHFTELLRGYRYPGFDCDEKDTNDWLHRAGSLYGSKRLRMFGLMDEQVLLGFIFLNVRQRRLRRAPGWIEIVALGVGTPHRSKALGRVMLQVIEEYARTGEFGLVPQAIYCKSRSDGCRKTLLRHGFEEIDQNEMFALRIT